MQMEASGAAGGEQLNSARAQHTYVIPPQDVREATDGSFWIVQSGAIAPFSALPNRTVSPSTPPAPHETDAGHVLGNLDRSVGVGSRATGHILRRLVTHLAK